MDPATIALIIKGIDVGLWALSRLPERAQEKEEALARVRAIVETGVPPTEADHALINEAISLSAQQRDELIAAKPE